MAFLRVEIPIYKKMIEKIIEYTDIKSACHQIMLS